MLRGLLENCDVKDSIVICSHSLPENFQQNLYGNPDSQGFDGTHLAGVDGKNHYTRSLCNILQKYLSKDSRELHNHTIPRALDYTHLTPALSPAAAPKPIPCAKPPTKPDSVVIDIEYPTEPDNSMYSYTVPTYNSFSVLGN